MNAPVQRTTRLIPELLDDIAHEARWQALDLVARRGREAAPNLLRGQAAEFFGSPLAYDLLLGQALDQAAEGLTEPAPAELVDLTFLLAPEELPGERNREIRAAAERLKGAGQWADDVIGRIERDAAQYERVRLLRAHALLNERFWSDARLPADDQVRARMLAFAPQLRQRADTAARRAGGWRDRLRLRLPKTLSNWF